MGFRFRIDRTAQDTRVKEGMFEAYRRVVSIDPGLQGTGVAVFTDGVIRSAGILTVPNVFRKQDWPVRADYLASALAMLVHPITIPTVVFCEMPEFQAGAGRSMGWKTGDLQRLAYLVGLYAGVVYPAAFVPVGVARWKGQLPKAVVEERLTKLIGAQRCRELQITSHAWDAVGIGMWALGRF